MKTIVAFTASLALATAGLAGSAGAVGCLSGAAAGAVVGHVAGHHAVAGAVVGCVAGHEMKLHQKRKLAAQKAAAAHAAGQPAPHR
jgi:hypothetical protein